MKKNKSNEQKLLKPRKESPKTNAEHCTPTRVRWHASRPLPGSDRELGVERRHAQDEVEVVPDAIDEVLLHVVPGFLLSRSSLMKKTNRGKNKSQGQKSKHNRRWVGVSALATTNVFMTIYVRVLISRRRRCSLPYHTGDTTITGEHSK